MSALPSVVELGQDCTETLLSGRPLLPWQLSAERARTDEITVQSSMIVVARMFSGSASAGSISSSSAGAGGQRLLAGGAAFHLWHPSTDVVTRKMDPLYQKNLDRWLCYAEATTEDELRQIQIA